MWAYVRTTVESGASTTMCVPAMPPRDVGSAWIVQPRTGSRCRTSRTLSRSAPASTSAPSAMSPAMPEKQWNQATVRWASGMARSQPEHAGDGHGGAEPVVDADDGHARRARREHPEQRGDALQAGAVAGARRHRDHGHLDDAANDARQRPFHAGDDDDSVGAGDRVDLG